MSNKYKYIIFSIFLIFIILIIGFGGSKKESKENFPASGPTEPPSKASSVLPSYLNKESPEVKLKKEIQESKTSTLLPVEFIKGYINEANKLVIELRSDYFLEDVFLSCSQCSSVKKMEKIGDRVFQGIIDVNLSTGFLHDDITIKGLDRQKNERILYKGLVIYEIKFDDVNSIVSDAIRMWIPRNAVDKDDYMVILTTSLPQSPPSGTREIYALNLQMRKNITFVKEVDFAMFFDAPDPSKVMLYKWNEQKNEWQEIKNTNIVDIEGMSIGTAIKELGIYAIFYKIN